MDCRRCGGNRLIKLDKKLKDDNDVFRCCLCGYIFSPLPNPSGISVSEPVLKRPEGEAHVRQGGRMLLYRLSKATVDEEAAA